MQIHFTGRNIDVTEAIKSYTLEKMQRVERRFKIINMNVTFTVENHNQIAEATVHMSGTDLHASAKSADLYAAIDELADKLLTQISKHKEKITDHHR